MGAGGAFLYAITHPEKIAAAKLAVPCFNYGFQNDYNRWSSDGRRIVFVVRVNAENELHAIDVDGTNHVILTSYPAEFNGWAPDGRVTFSSNVSGSYDLYLINADGTGRVNLTSTSTSDEMRALWVKR